LLGEDALSLLEHTKIACIGPITAATAMSAGLKVDIISPVYTTEGLVDTIVKDCAN
ncbi:MAG: uroporphyrinogen-III synthase, partial [Veillonella sp.]|nr:uroporphyrinogen-III synthase [Veillonella sp.]